MARDRSRRQAGGSIVGSALILDFGGVISKTLFETHPQSEAALGLPPGSLTWRGPFDLDSDPQWQTMLAGEMTERDYWLLRTEETGRLVGAEWTRMEQFLQATRGADPMGSIRPEALAAVEEAVSRGHKLGVLSNELDLYYGPEFRRGLPFLEGFDSIIDATYTGVLKPEPAAYRAACDALQLPPSACLFVDDQPRNIAGAEAVGMATVQFDVRNPTQGYGEALRRLTQMETATS